MPIDTLIARGLAIFWVVCGVSHALHPAKWAAFLLPFRERETGGLVLASMSFPIGLVIILGHNIWVWDLPVIVTVAGWMTTVKSVIYLLFPRAHTKVMSANIRPERGLRIIGLVLIVLGAVSGYDAFFRR
jgi:uncharacterized protein YjeT (DUF2065 family)